MPFIHVVNAHEGAGFVYCNKQHLKRPTLYQAVSVMKFYILDNNACRPRGVCIMSSRAESKALLIQGMYRFVSFGYRFSHIILFRCKLKHRAQKYYPMVESLNGSIVLDGWSPCRRSVLMIQSHRTSNAISLSLLT